MNERKYNEAEKLLLKAIERDEKCWIPYLNMARLYLIKDVKGGDKNKDKIKRYINKSIENGMEEPCRTLLSQENDFLILQNKPWFEEIVSNCSQ